MNAHEYTDRSPKIRRILDVRPSWMVRHGSLLLLILFIIIAITTYLLF